MDDMTSFTTHNATRRGTVRVTGATPLARAVYAADTRLTEIRNALMEQIDLVTTIVSRTRKALYRDGHPVNPLGELQANGPRFDLLCGQLALADEHFTELAAVAVTAGVATYLRNPAAAPDPNPAPAATSTPRRVNRRRGGPPPTV